MEYPAKGCCEPRKTKLKVLNKYLEFQLLTKLQFQHQTSGRDSNQPVEFALAGAERQSHKQGQCQTRQHLGQFYGPAEFRSRCAGAEPGYHFITPSFISPEVSRSPRTMEYFQTEYNILPPGAAPPRKADLPHHQTQGDRRQKRTVCSTIKLCPARKNTNSAAKGLGRNNLDPASFIPASFPHPTRVLGGRGGGGGNASPCSEPSAGGAEAGMSEFGEGRTNLSRLMPSLEGAERGLVQLLPSCGDSPLPALPLPPHPTHKRRNQRPDPPTKTWKGGTDGAAPFRESSGSVEEKE